MKCPACEKDIVLTGKGEYRVHGPKSNRCPGSSTRPGDMPDTVYLGSMSGPEAPSEAPMNGETPAAPSSGSFADWEPKDPELAAAKAENAAKIAAARGLTVVSETSGTMIDTPFIEDPMHKPGQPIPMSTLPAEPAPARQPVVPCLQGWMRLESLNASVVMGTRDAAAEAMRMLRETPGRRLACDIETEGLGMLGRNIKCVIFSELPTGERAIILDPRDTTQFKLIRYILAEAGELVFHNSAYDIPNMAVNGLFDVDWCAKVTDTLLYARLAEPGQTVSKKLADCANRYLGLAYDNQGMKTSARAVGINSDKEMYRKFDLDRPVYVRGAATDAIVTARLLSLVRKAALQRLMTGHPFEDWGVKGQEALQLIQREQRLNRMSLRRTVRGFRVDLEFLDRFNERYGAEMAQQGHALNDVGIRPGVAQDLLDKLVEWGTEFPPDYPRTAKTKALSGQKAHLELINSDWARLFVSNKESTKILNDYLEKVRDHSITDAAGDDRIHPVVSYLAATTGRMSISGDPLHQFPGPARGVILADPGDNLTSIDWSQIEPVVIANLAGQLDILEGYEAGTMDFYDAVSAAAGLPRKLAKTQTLGTLYGQGLKLTAAKLGVDIDEARRIKDSVFAPMPKVLDFTYVLRDIAQQYEMVPTVSGRILPIPSGYYTDERTGEARWSVQTHKGVNYPTQGGAYDVLAESMIAAEDAGYGDAIYLAMHDELVVSTEASRDIQKIMATPPERLILHSGRTPVLRTDLKDLGERWNVA